MLGRPRQRHALVRRPPSFGAEFGVTFGTGGAPPTVQPTAHEAHDIHSAVGEQRFGPWKLYDDKFVLDPKKAYNAKDAATWLDDLRD